MNHNRYNHKTFLAVISIVLAIILLMGYRFISAARDNLYTEKLTYLDEVAQKSAYSIRQQINGKLETILGAATFIAGHEDTDPTHWLALLCTQAKTLQFKRMGIIMPDGTAYTTDGYTFDFSDRSYYQAGMQGKCAMSDRLVDKIDGQEINVYAAPIKQKDGVVLGVVFATHTQDQFAQSMSIESFGGNGYSALITMQGDTVANSVGANVDMTFENYFEYMQAKNFDTADIEQMRADLQNAQNGNFTYKQGKELRQVFYTPVGVNDWYLLQVITPKEISYQSNRLLAEMIVLSIIIIVLIALAFVIFIRAYRKTNLRLEHVAYTDNITQCNNFAKFKLDAAKLLAEHPGQRYAAISLDIRKFKVINDIYGHATGNNVLLYIANTLAKNIGPDETFCRAAADNFNVLLKYDTEDGVIAWMQEIQRQVRSYISAYKIELDMGVYVVEGDSIAIDMLCDRANISRAIAKKQNDEFYHFFKEKNRIDILSEQEIENAMEAAIQGKEFLVYLQPKIRLSSESVAGGEALVRWDRPGKGLVPPNDFIPLFERNGFVRKLDLYMFDSVCAIMEQWIKNNIGKHMVPISVNISRVHLSDAQLPQRLLAIANRHNIPPNLLEIELTESAVFLDGESMMVMMQSIKDAGFLVSIDDFGSGYSSLSALKDLPVDFVKIDKTFLDCAVNDTKGGKILESIISMTKWLGLVTVAEGVETEEQCAFLRSAGCDLVQGYFYSRPVPVQEFELLMQAEQIIGKTQA